MKDKKQIVLYICYGIIALYLFGALFNFVFFTTFTLLRIIIKWSFYAAIIYLIYNFFKNKIKK